MNRSVAAVALLSATAVALSACGSSSPRSSSTSPSSSGAAAGSKVVNLTFWHGYTADDGKVLDKIVDAFNASQGGVKVTYAVKTWAVIETTLLPALTAKQGPQIVALPAEQLPVYAGKGAMADLSSYYTSSANAATISPEAVQLEVVKGKKYGVPTGFVPLSVIYNKKLFAAAGISSFPKTWDEWAADAKKLTVDANHSGTPQQYGLALPDHQTVANGVWASLFAENGGAIANGSTAVLNSPQNVKTLRFWADAVKNDHISPTGLDGIKADGLFSSGKAAMEIGGPWMAGVATDNKIDYGLAPIPAGPVTQAASAIGVSMGVTEQATPAQKAAAEKFFDYFYSLKVAAQWSLGSGWPPLRTGVAASAVVGNPVVAALTAMAPSARPLLPGVVNSADVLSAVDDATQHALAGQDPATALANAQPKVQAALR